ncbi:MAG: hypothetical protein IPL38_08750 [Rhodobacter sp.]|nr:hypothetical protein [Rhodobacter sp.]
MAIAGNLSAATAVYTVGSNALQNLHSFNPSDQLSSSDVGEFLLRLSPSNFDDVKSLKEKGLLVSLFSVSELVTKQNAAHLRLGISAEFNNSLAFTKQQKSDLEIRKLGLIILGGLATTFRNFSSRTRRTMHVGASANAFTLTLSLGETRVLAGNHRYCFLLLLKHPFRQC